MFFQKKKRIDHLVRICQMKDLNARKAVCDADALREELRVRGYEVNALKRHLSGYKLTDADHVREIGELKADIEKRRRLYRHKNERQEQRIKELATENRELKSCILMYQNNMKALCGNYDETQAENIALRQSNAALTSRLDVFERMLGKVNNGETKGEDA